MRSEVYEDPRILADAEREEYENEHDSTAALTKYAKRRRMLEKDEWYSILDEKE